MTIKTTKTLPDKPSELIRLAIKDLELCREDPLVEIKMSQWFVKDSNGVCSVCLAGAVMKQEFNEELSKEIEKSSWDTIGENGDLEVCPGDFDKDICNKLCALNSFRLGLINQGCGDLGVKTKFCDRHIITYSFNNHEYFCQQMLKLACDLEAEGN